MNKAGIFKEGKKAIVPNNICTLELAKSIAEKVKCNLTIVPIEQNESDYVNKEVSKAAIKALVDKEVPSEAIEVRPNCRLEIIKKTEGQAIYLDACHNE